MDEKISRSLLAVRTIESLAQLEENVRKRVRFDDELSVAFRSRAISIARQTIAERLNVDLTQLTPAEEKIIGAASEYLAIKRRTGTNANRTIGQLKNRGLIEAAELSVARAQPTQGYQTLDNENLNELSYEQIIVDHPLEFSQRGLWFARRTLNLPNPTEKPPARRSIPAQARSEELLAWLEARTDETSGLIKAFSNAEAAAAIGMADLTRYGRVYGNIQSRLDFACYRINVPPIGLAAEAGFKDAWQQDDRTWKFPIESMQRAAKGFRWRPHHFARLMKETQSLPGQAHVPWKAELRDNQAAVQSWATNIGNPPIEPMDQTVLAELSPSPKKKISNPDWTYEEHVLGIDLYFRLRGTSYPDEHPEIVALSRTLHRLAALRGMSGDETFRNANGVSMKMLNFRRMDPEHASIGLTAGSNMELTVWEDFYGFPQRLTAAVRLIRRAIDGNEVSPPLVNELTVAEIALSELEALLSEDPAVDKGSDRSVSNTIDDGQKALDRMARIETAFLGASPEGKNRLSKGIERGPIGRLVKRINKFRCQLCHALGDVSVGFKKKNGEFYVEAHHVMPVHRREVGSLSATNIVTLCANHHREVHYGDVRVEVGAKEFVFSIGRQEMRIPRTGVEPKKD